MPSEGVDIRVSLSEIDVMSPSASIWIRGFLAGNLPRPPTADDGPELENWKVAAAHFQRTGDWPRPDWPTEMWPEGWSPEVSNDG